MNHQPQPPTVDAVCERIAHTSLPPTSIAAAALHLLSPVSTLVGMHIHCDPEQWVWGTESVAAPRSLRLRGVVEAAAAFVQRRSPLDAQYLDLTGSCLKPIRSGAYHLLGGAFLYSAPELLIAPDIADPAAVGLSWIRAAAGSPDAVGIIDLDGVSYLVHGDDRVIAIHSTTTNHHRTNLPQWDVETVQVLISELLDLDDVEAASIGSRLTNTVDIDYVGSISAAGERYEIIVPSTIGAGLVLGAPHGSAVPEVGSWYAGPRETPWRPLDGYDPIEPARFEPGWVARHRASGVCVIVRHDIEY